MSLAPGPDPTSGPGPTSARGPVLMPDSASRLRAVLSIGSNLGDSQEMLQAVLDQARREGILQAASRLYSTPPWGGVEQDDFLNAVIVIDVQGGPQDVLAWAQQREREAGRTREVRWGPRTLDVDVISLRETENGRDVICNTPQLTVPHPRAVERAFVLVPWLEVDPAAKLDGKAIVDLLAALDPGEVAAVREAGEFSEETT